MHAVVFALAHLGAAVIAADLIEAAGVQVFEDVADAGFIVPAVNSETHRFLLLLDAMAKHVFLGPINKLRAQVEPGFLEAELEVAEDEEPIGFDI